jgi:hypothetical protein
MSFDARSLERLQELGRSLPQPLPKPVPKAAVPAKASERRHAVETEENPEALFRELMQVSPDGSVPPHLLERLRDLEQTRRTADAASRRTPEPRATAPKTPGSTAAAGRTRATAQGPGDDDLYVAFQQLLLEDEES